MFANGWAIFAGILAVALPFLIHWLTKPRPMRVPVSTLKFIRGAVAERRAKYRLRDILVLCCRAAAVLLFAAAIARPLWNHVQRKATAEQTDVTRFILLDCSQSMAARDGGIIRFERARSIANDLLKYRSGLKCNLLLAGARSNAVFDAPTTNLSALKQALSDSAVRPEQMNVQEALNRISEMSSTTDQDSEIELIVVSDFQRSNWATANFSVLPESCTAELHSVASEDAVANLAVVDFKVIGALEAQRETDIAITVGNFSETPRDVQVEVTLGDVVVPVGGLCAAESETVLTGRLPVKAAGWYSGKAEILAADDSLAADNERPIALRVWPSPRIAILTRDPAGKTSTAAWYIQQALQATMSTSDRESLFFVDANDPDLEQLKTADIVIAVRPGRLTQETLPVLRAGLQRGKSVLYIASDQLDAVNLNQMASTFGSDLRLPVDFLPRPSERSGAKRLLTSVNPRAVPFNVFGDELPSAIGALEFSGGLMSRPNPDGLADDIRGTLDDQSSFLTVSAAGRGRFAVLNADLQRSNLARTPVMVPLLAELLANDLASSHAEQNRFLCGEPFTMNLDATEAQVDELNVLGPEEEEILEQGSFHVSASGLLWDVPLVDRSGVYQVKVQDDLAGMATAEIPALESDLRTLSASVFEGRLSGGRSLVFHGASSALETRVDTIWVWLACLCVGFMVLELFILKLFRS